jgi:nicotinate phosphoribosyltransferase
MALDAWVNVFGGSLGIALTDTFTTDAFFRPDGFSLVHAKMFDGVRHDSGDPLVFINKAVAYYKSLGIDPLTKTAIFSDGISSLETVEKIVKACDGKIKPRFGIGTWLTNDLPGVKPLNIVIKMTAIQNGDWWIPTVKLSDVETKHTGNEQMIERYKQELLLDKGKGTI